MGIRKTWVSALQLYGRSFSKTWHLGILYGAILTISFATSPALTAKEPIIKILGLALPPMVFLFSVYLSSLIFLRIHKANIGQNISLKDSLVFVNQKYLKVLAGLLLVSIITSLGGMGLLLPGSLHLTTSSSTYIPWIYTLGSNISFIILLLTSVLFSLTLPLILLDDAGIIEGLKRSCKLTWQRWWHSFFVIIPLYIAKYLLVLTTNSATVSGRWHIVAVSAIATMLLYPLIYSFILTLLNDLKKPN